MSLDSKRLPVIQVKIVEYIVIQKSFNLVHIRTLVSYIALVSKKYMINDSKGKH